jgi:DNA-binding IclR family transcriptional regulator
MVLDGNAVRSVDRAAALLLALGESQGEAGVTELARRLGLHKSTASRLLATLQKRGLVEQDDETGKYRLGLVVIRLAERAERTLDLRGIAMPELERLARLTHETTGVGILDGESLLTVAQVDGPNLIAVGDWTGRSTPLHCVASGKVLMSSLAEREVLRIVRRGLIQYTERTIVELEPLLEELARIRRRGYATAIGEYELGLNAVSAPIHDARGNVVAAVDIWGPAFRLTPRRAHRHRCVGVSPRHTSAMSPAWAVSNPALAVGTRDRPRSFMTDRCLALTFVGPPRRCSDTAPAIAVHRPGSG